MDAYIESIKKFFEAIGATYEFETFSCGVAMYLGRVNGTEISLIVNETLLNIGSQFTSNIKHTEMAIRSGIHKASDNVATMNAYKKYEDKIVTLANRSNKHCKKTELFHVHDSTLIYKKGVQTLEEFQYSYSLFCNVYSMLDDWWEARP